jgi:uncharacterized membrane protein YbaN (DUF454 family)
MSQSEKIKLTVLVLVTLIVCWWPTDSISMRIIGAVLAVITLVIVLRDLFSKKHQ